MSENARRCTGAAVGAAIGILVYWLVLRTGTSVLAAVGAGPALGVSCAARTRSLAWGFVTMVLSVVLTLLVLFLSMSSKAAPSLGDFLAHLDDLSRNRLITLGVVALLGFWFGRGRERKRAATPEA